MHNQIDGEVIHPWIAIEGGDAVGKTTVCEYVKTLITDLGLSPVLSTGHAHGDFGQMIRTALLHPYTAEVSQTSQLLLFLANRAHIFNELVYPAMMNGQIPIVDRWHMTSYAYQTQAVNLEKFCLLLTPTLPTLSIVLLASRETSLERRGNRNRATDHLEQRAIEFANDLNEKFLDIAERGIFSGDYIIINANEDLQSVLANVRKAVINHLTDLGVIKDESRVIENTN